MQIVMELKTVPGFLLALDLGMHVRAKRTFEKQAKPSALVQVTAWQSDVSQIISARHHGNKALHYFTVPWY